MLNIEEALGIKDCDECLRKRECTAKLMDDRIRGCDKCFCATEEDVTRVRMEIWDARKKQKMPEVSKKNNDPGDWQDKWEEW